MKECEKIIAISLILCYNKYWENFAEYKVISWVPTKRPQLGHKLQKPKDMKLPELSNAMYKLKSSPEEVEAMCKEFSSTYLDGKAEGKLETALNMLSDGVLSFEKIAQYSGLSVEQVKELSKKMDEQ